MLKKSIYNLAPDLKEALLRNELEILFQPKVDIASEAVIGAEVFMQWTHFMHGLISPEIWVKIATKFDLLQDIALWTLNHVIKLIRATPKNHMVYSINIPPSVLEEGFVKSVHNIIQKAGLPNKRIEFEITEQETITDFVHTAKMVKYLQNLGIIISLDDFGAGYCSMQYLIHLPVNTVKIDKSFVQDAPHNPVARSVLKSLIKLAKDVQASVVCEGIETTQQLKLVAELGADTAQGYYYGRPVPFIDQQWLTVSYKPHKIASTGNS